MPTVLESLSNLEKDLIANDSPEGIYGGKFEQTWMSSENRARLLGVLARLNDLNVVNAQAFPNYEFAFTFAGGGKALWVSYTGYSFNIWTNLGAPEAQFETSSNIVLVDHGDQDARPTVVQVIRDYFRPELVEAV